MYTMFLYKHNYFIFEFTRYFFVFAATRLYIGDACAIYWPNSDWLQAATCTIVFCHVQINNSTTRPVTTIVGIALLFRLLIPTMSTNKRKCPSDDQNSPSSYKKMKMNNLPKISQFCVSEKTLKIHEPRQNSVEIDKNGNYLNYESVDWSFNISLFITTKFYFSVCFFYIDQSKPIENEKEKSASISTQLMFNTVANMNKEEDLARTPSQTVMLKENESATNLCKHFFGLICFLFVMLFVFRGGPTRAKRSRPQPRGSLHIFGPDWNTRDFIFCLYSLYLYRTR